MKWFASFTAAVLAGGAALAADGPAGPSVPQVPAPVIQNGLPAASPFGPAHRSFSLTSLIKKPTVAAPVQASTPAAAMPPLPTALVAPPVPCAVPAACAVRDRGTCFERMKRWLAYAPCEVHLPVKPVPYYAPDYEFFACKSNCGTAGGGAPAAAANCAPPARGLFARTPKEKCAPDCDPRTGPTNAGLPGFRFASPENPAVGAGHVGPGPVESASFKMPAYGAKPQK